MVAASLVVFAWFAVGSPVTVPVGALDLQLDPIAGITSQDPPPPEPQKPKPTKVVGRVKNSEGRPEARAQVFIKGPDDFERETWTNGEGAFEFTGLSGEYRITIKAGDKEDNFDASIREGRLIPSEFTLQPRA